MLIIRAIEPLGALTPREQRELADLVEDVGEFADGWMDEELVVYVVFDTDAAYEQAQRLVVAPRSDDLKPGDTVVYQCWTATQIRSVTRNGIPVEPDTPRLDVAGRLAREPVK